MGPESCLENPLIRYMTLGKVQGQSCSTHQNTSFLDIKWGIFKDLNEMMHAKQWTWAG